MRILIALEHHFVRCPEGVFTHLSFGYDYWQEYLKVFDEVVVAARVSFSIEKPEGMLRADGVGVRFFQFSEYQGMRHFFIRLPWLFAEAIRAAYSADRFLLRSGNIGTLMWIALLLTAKFQYARECMGNMKEALTTEMPNNFCYQAIANIYNWLCKVQVRGAICCSYTSEYLRRCYPCRNHSVEHVFSGVRISDEVITAPRNKSFFAQKPFRFISVGRIEKQKGHLWLIQAAVELAKKQDIPEWSLEVIGGGNQLTFLRSMVKSHGLADRINFLGEVTWGNQLFSHLDRSHLFVLPSLTEGMPRALIEAMARGMPAIGSNTGGIPELLPDENMVAVGDIPALADKMAGYIKRPQELAKMSAQNFATAANFRLKIVEEKKLVFWRYLHHHG